MSERRWVEFLPGDTRRPARGENNVCTICGCYVAPRLRPAHLLVCPVVHPEKVKDK